LKNSFNEPNPALSGQFSSNVTTDPLPLRVVQLTPPGRGAVASILVDGPGAADLVQALVRTKSGRPLGDFPDDRLVVGHFGDENGEEVVIRRRGPQTIELHCHGGYAATTMIEDTLRIRGCQSVAWRQWIAQRHEDPIAAAALAALADAPTQRTAAILLDQFHGALSRAFEATEHDIELKNYAAAQRQVESLLAYMPLGMHLTKPWRVILAGPPNAGKSSLINALVGFQRSIVHHTPGTTRDAVTAATAMDGWPVELCDTAGLHDEAQGIEKAGVELARQRISEADLLVLVFDLSQNWSASDQSLIEAFPDALVVHNKTDITSANCSSGENRPEGHVTSALTGAGMDELIEKIAKRLVPAIPPLGAAVPFTSEQIDLVQGFARVVKKG
jgi:tRNA modification GTPase